MTATIDAADLWCPVCRGEVRETGGATPEFRCDACNRTYPVVLGIPDFRVFADPYIGIEADRAKGLRLAERYADTDFAGLARYYYSITDTVPAAQARMFMAGLFAAPHRAQAALQAWRTLSGEPPVAPGSRSAARFVEIGCGTAPMLVNAGRMYSLAVGVDIAFRWLVVARKRLEEAGLDVPLVCACAEALPFRNATFDVAAYESVLEVTRDQNTAAAQGLRVLTRLGRVYVATPNRWSIGPDPHLGVPAGGWWPRTALSAYARARGALPPQRHLLSAGSLRRLLSATGFDDIRITLPDIADAQRTSMHGAGRAAVELYRAVKDLPVVHGLLLSVGPLLLATARRPDGIQQK
jgi:SAM-dependent methyltransferase